MVTHFYHGQERDGKERQRGLKKIEKEGKIKHRKLHSHSKKHLITEVYECMQQNYSLFKVDGNKSW